MLQYFTEDLRQNQAANAPALFPKPDKPAGGIDISDIEANKVEVLSPSVPRSKMMTRFLCPLRSVDLELKRQISRLY